MNVLQFTAFEAEYNQLGTLNIKDATLNLQNVNSVSGTIDLAPTGASLPSILNVTEKHGHTAQFNNLNIVQTVPPSGTNQVQLNIGGSLGPVDASFVNVTAPDVVLNVAGSGSTSPASAIFPAWAAPLTK